METVSVETRRKEAMTTQTLTQIPTGTWTVDPIHSSARFEVRHSGVSTFRSGFGELDARLIGGEEPRLEGVVKVESIEVAEEQLKGHLLSPEFFDAEHYRELRFVSTELSAGEDGELRVRGELDIKATKHVVEAHGRIAHIDADLAGGERIGLSLETAVDRSDFGLDWNAELPGGGPVLENEVRLVVELELTPEAS
jgi:polyisoprenoid-binding protein YceI